MTCYSGIDLHSNNNLIVVSDEADRILCHPKHGAGEAAKAQVTVRTTDG